MREPSRSVVWTLDKAWTLAVSLARTERIPTAQEMFADGPHLATAAFEIGDPGLGKEVGHGLDVVLRRRAGPVTGSVSVFANQFDRFIFPEPTDEVQDDLRVYRFIAREARFHGAEMEATWHLHETGGHTLDVTVTADFVRATNRATNTPLPRIPPWRAGLALDYTSGRWETGFNIQHTAEQRRVAPGETPSDAYLLVSAFVQYAVPLGHARVLALFVRGANLTDDEARPHTSFLKELAPLPGRNVTLGARLTF